MSTVAPAPALFIREHVSQPENRVNLALFCLMALAPVRRWFLNALELPSDCVVYPPQHQAGRRPDLVAVRPDGVVAAWIEIELGGENKRQLADYRSVLAPDRVLSIVGLVRGRDGAAHLSLQEISDAVGTIRPELDAQQRVLADVFVGLVAQLARAARPSVRVAPGPAVLQSRLLRSLSNHLGEVLRFDEGQTSPGTARVETIGGKGWTIRVYAKGTRGGSVSLLSDPGGRGQIAFPSLQHLRQYLAGFAADRPLRDYAALLGSLGINSAAIQGRQTLRLSDDVLLRESARLAQCIRALAGIFATP